MTCPECASVAITITARYPNGVSAADAAVAHHWRHGELVGVTFDAGLLGLPVADVECEDCGWSAEDVELQLVGRS